MRLLHKDFQFIFDLKENDRGMLVIEHPETYRKLLQEMLLGEEGAECGFVLSEANVPVKLKENLCCIINPWMLTLNERKLLNKLYDLLKKEILSSNLLLEMNEACAMLENYSEHITQLADWELAHTDKIEVQDFLKFMDIRFAEKQESLLEKIIDYIGATHELLNLKFFVFIQLTSYLNEYEIEKLYEFVQYQKIDILLIESRQPEDIKRFNPVIIIDKDCCEIDLNMQ